MGTHTPVQDHSVNIDTLKRGGGEGGGRGGGGWVEGEGGAAIWGGSEVDAGYVDAFLAAALTRVMRPSVPIPAVAVASVLHTTAVGGSVLGIVGPLQTFEELHSCELGVFRL